MYIVYIYYTEFEVCSVPLAQHVVQVGVYRGGRVRTARVAVSVQVCIYTMPCNYEHDNLRIMFN